MKKTLNGVLSLYKGLMMLIDPATEGNPYVREEIVEQTITTKYFGFFQRRRFAIK